MTPSPPEAWLHLKTGGLTGPDNWDKPHDEGCPGCEIERLEVELRELQEALTDLHSVIEEYILWEPGRAGHAAAHRKLVAAALAASSEEPG